MTLKFHFIEGNRRQICNNDAVSVVQEKDGRDHVLEIIPVENNQGKSRSEIIQAVRTDYLKRICKPV